MNDPDAHGSTRPVSIVADDVHHAAWVADTVGTDLADALTIVGASNDAANSLTGWESVENIRKTAAQWKAKTDAIVYGPKGLADFAQSLRTFVAATTDVDVANATELDTDRKSNV